MVNEGKRKQLGRGLSALLGEDELPESEQRRMIRVVPIEFLHPGKFQPRQHMDEERLEELAQSIREKGILQPLLVRRHADQGNSFEIIAGERRWRAAQRAQLHEVPVIIKDLSDREALEIGLIENLQRQDLSPLEEADGYRRLMEEFSHTQQELAEVVGKSRSHVANMMRLLSLPPPIKDMVTGGSLTAGHARALLNAPNPVQLAERVARQNLNVRQTERLVQASVGRTVRKPREAVAKDADTLALERDLSNRLGLKVDIRFLGGGGTLTIAYETLEQLDDVLRRLSAEDAGGSDSQGGAIPGPARGVRPALDEDPLGSWEAEAGAPGLAVSQGTMAAGPNLEAALDAFDQAAEAFDAPATPIAEAELDAVVLAAEGPSREEDKPVFDTASLDAVLTAAERREGAPAASAAASDLDDSFDLEEDSGPGGAMPLTQEAKPEAPKDELKRPEEGPGPSARPPLPASSRGLVRELSDE